jgi:predicted permease
MNWYRRLRKIVRHHEHDGEIAQEFDQHIAEAIDHFVAAGMSEEEARFAARRQFGNYTLHQEHARDIAFPLSIADMCRDLRYAARQLRRTPIFSVVVLLALGIGIGANVTIFGLVSALILRPLDVHEPSRLVRILGEGGNTDRAAATNSEAHIPLNDYWQYRDQNQSFTDLAAQSIGGPARVRIDNGPPQMIPVMPVSGNYFRTLGVTAAIGRTITPTDARAGAANVIVLSDAGWRRFFGADPAVLGKAVLMNGIVRTIVGVTPDSFKGTTSPLVPQMYAPIPEGVASFRVDLLGRLKPDISADQARADLMRIAAHLTLQDQQRRSIEIYPAKVLVPFLLTRFFLFAALFLIIVGVVLLIVCDNIAVLLFARAEARRTEIGIRLALGAGPSRIFAQLVMESFLLCVMGGLVGLYLAHLTARLLTQIYLPVPMPFALTFNLDWRVVVFVFGVVFLATVLCGIMPAMQSLRADVVHALKGTGTNGSRVRSGLIITQVTLSSALLVTAAGLAHSLLMQPAQARGFIADGVVMATINISGPAYTPQRRVAFLTTLLKQFEQDPAIAAATIVDTIPLTNNNPMSLLEVQSGGRIQPVYTSRIARGFFATLGIPLITGRDFTANDTLTSPAAGIVNEALALRFWPGAKALGQYLKTVDGSVIEVIGVAQNSKYESIDEAEKAVLYRPATQEVVAPTFLIKAKGEPSAILPLIRTRLANTDPELVPYNLMTLNERLGLSMLINRAAATLAGSMGLLVLALGAIGIFGTMSLLVQERRREIGIRMALGASSRQVKSSVTRQGMRWTATGLLLGLLGGLGALQWLSGVVYGVTAADPGAVIIPIVVLGTSAWAACYFPARRAARHDSLTLLRGE